LTRTPNAAYVRTFMSVAVNRATKSSKNRRTGVYAIAIIILSLKWHPFAIAVVFFVGLHHTL